MNMRVLTVFVLVIAAVALADGEPLNHYVYVYSGFCVFYFCTFNRDVKRAGAVCGNDTSAFSNQSASS